MNGGNMRNKDRRRHGVLKPKLLALFTVVVLLLLIPATANATVYPDIKSPDSYTFTVGIEDYFTIETADFTTTPSIDHTGDTLPSGLYFWDYGDGTARIYGNPYYGAGGVYHITITAANGVDPAATQEFTLTVNMAPYINSDNAYTFTVGTDDSFDIRTSGYPTPSITCDPLPSGLDLYNNGDGTAQISGTPAAGTADVYHITVTASNDVGDDYTQEFTLTVNEAPAITSDDSCTFTTGIYDDYFTIETANFSSSPTISVDSLPSGLSLDDYGDGTADIWGKPDYGTADVYHITITASNGIDDDVTQDFTLTVNEGVPTFTSDNSHTFTAGVSEWFEVRASSTSTLTCDELPDYLSFTDWGDGEARIAGTPDLGTGGVYSITITASNGVGPDATQEFTLTVNEAPAITNLNIAAFAEGNPGEFTFTTTGYPKPAISSVGSLPTGVSLVDNGNGTATLSGTPAAGTGGAYPITITAGNSIGSAATQYFTLTVNRPPTIDSENHCTFTVGTEGIFEIMYSYASGTNCSDDLPSGVTFRDWGDNVASFSGTPDPGTGGVYNVTLTTSGSLLSPATQEFTLTVNEAPASTSLNNATFTAGAANSFTFTTTGYPAPTLSCTGALPSGVNFSPHLTASRMPALPASTASQ
jgi:hypothetical protein